MLRSLSVCCLAVSLAWVSTEAGPPPEGRAPDIAEIMARAAGGEAGEPSEEAAGPKFEDVTKDMESHEGMLRRVREGW